MRQTLSCLLTVLILLTPIPSFAQSLACTILVDWAEIEEGLDKLFLGA
jgi:hypothetical protein